MKIHGGSHLGIVGCYLLREFEDNLSDEEINKLFMEEYKYGLLPIVSCAKPDGIHWESEDLELGMTIHRITNSEGQTIFEWCRVVEAS